MTYNTLLIIGAGASVPYGYPTGQKLKSYIIEHFESHFTNIQDYVPKDNPIDIKENERKVKKFINKFKTSPTESIDLFIARHSPDFNFLGKLAIVMSIMELEKESEIFYENMIQENQKQDWYKYLINNLISTLKTPDSIKDFKQNDVAFITFNYDRSFEYYLYESLMSTFRMNDNLISEVYNIIKQYPVYHIYGKMDHLPWENPSGKSYKFEYRKPEIVELTKNINTVFEVSGANYAEIRQTIKQFDRIFFLGFGYAKENLDILNIPNIFHDGQEIYGTAIGFKEKQINNIINKFTTFHDTHNRKGLQKHSIKIEPINCLQLLEKYL